MAHHNDSHSQGKRSLKEVDWGALTAGRTYYPSPTAWEDEVLYFLLIDRFSDGKEYDGFANVQGAPVTGPTARRTTQLFKYPDDVRSANRQEWFEQGKTWCGGTLAGLTDKLGYLKRLERI